MSRDDTAADQLRLLVERIEGLEERKAEIADDIKAVYAESKALGYDTKTMRAIIRLRRMDVNERREHEALLDTYKAALGMLDGTPLGHWAVEKIKRARPPGPEDSPDQAPAAGTPEGGEPRPDAPEPRPAPEPAPPPVTVEDARKMGRLAAQAGKAVTSNPFRPGDVFKLARASEVAMTAPVAERRAARRARA